MIFQKHAWSRYIGFVAEGGALLPMCSGGSRFLSGGTTSTEHSL